MAKTALKLVVYTMCWSDKKEGLCGNILNRCTTLHTNNTLKKTPTNQKNLKKNQNKTKQKETQKTNTENHHTIPAATSF